MAARILEGEKVNESGRGACFYDSTTGQAYGPMFEDAQEAERFLTYLAGIDPGRLCWDGREWDSGTRLHHQWLGEGKPERRPVFQFDYTWYSFVETNPEDSGEKAHWAFSSDMECLFPFMRHLDCNVIGRVLLKHGVAKQDEIDTESSCVFGRFWTEKDAKDFIDQFNAFLRENWHKAYGGDDSD